MTSKAEKIINGLDRITSNDLNGYKTPQWPQTDLNVLKMTSMATRELNGLKMTLLK